MSTLRNTIPGLALLVFIALPAPAQQQAAPARLADFFLGEWDVQSLSADGSRVVGRARTQVRRILDGAAMQADYYGLDPSGRTVFRGTTIRTWAPAQERYIVHWSMANLPGYTYLEEEIVDGELHAKGHGRDGQGEFQERYRYFDISDSTYSFQGERSRDGGVSWQPFANLRAVKRADSPP